MTRPIFCTNPSERVYITAWGCEIGSGGRNAELRPPCPGRAHRSRSTRRRFPPLRNSSRPDCHPLEPQNSLALAGQRLTESQRRYVEVETEALRSLKVILRTNLAMTPARAEARVTGHCRTQGRRQRPQSRDTGGEVVLYRTIKYVIVLCLRIARFRLLEPPFPRHG